MSSSPPAGGGPDPHQGTPSWLSKLRGPLDVINKVALVGIAVWAPIFANHVQERMTGIQLLTQREQAESQLRASMFHDLINPIIGTQGPGQIQPEQEQLLAELLALNFHEHFEFKPLLEHVDARLAKGPVVQDQAGAREALRSIARRIMDRQVTSLVSEGAHVVTLIVGPKDDNPSDRTAFIAYGEPRTFTTPDRNDKLTLYFDCPADSCTGNWTSSGEDTIRVHSLVSQALAKGETKGQGGSNSEFILSPFDFPLTDNTMLDDGNRFALCVKNSQYDRDQGQFRIRLIWFPKGYFTQSERPLNIKDYQSLVHH